MNKDTTAFLEEKLIQTDNEEELDAYLESEGTLMPYDTFHVYYLELVRRKDLDLTELIHASGIERTYCYQIFNGRRLHPGRDKIIRLCLVAKLSVRETQRALKIADEAVLYVRNSRDAVIMYALQKGMSCEETDLLLDRHKEEALA